MRAGINFLLALTLTVLVGSQALAQSTELRWSLEKGQKLQVVSENKSMSIMDTPAGQQKIPAEMTTTLIWEVVDVKDGIYEITQKIDRLQVKMTNPAIGDIEYDSKDEKEVTGVAAAMVNNFKNLLGQETTLKINNRGVVQKSEGDEQSASAAQGMMVAQEMTSQIFFELPEKAVTKGNSWKQKIENKNEAGTITMNNKYTYQGKDDSSGNVVHKIQLDGEVEMDMEQQGIQMELEESSVKGTLYFDATSGYLSKAEIKQEMVMQMEAFGQSMTNETKADVKVTVKPLK